MNRRVLLAVGLLAGLVGIELASASEPLHGLSIFRELKFPPDFQHFDYVNPDAPKGGTLRIPAGGTFFSLNPFIRQGGAAQGLEANTYDTLLTRAWDEFSALYGLLAETVELADDRSWIEFELRPQARWHDGVPVTADDVVFTFEVLKEKGSPREKTLLLAIIGAEKLGPRRVRIHMSDRAARRLPLQISSEIQILPHHYWATREFDQTTLEPPLGSGPYRVAELNAGRNITYERVPDYWGRDLNVNIGRFNFDRIQYKYYQDIHMQVEAIKGREVDWKSEALSKVWATAYETPAKRRGHFIQEMIETQRPTHNYARVLNLRRKKFQDPRTREALTWAYDFEWVNEVIYFGEYGRMRSYFQNSDMEHRGPPSPQELALLERFRSQLDPRVFEREYEPPQTRGTGSNRENLLVADRLLKEAGWVVQDGARVDAKSGKRFEVEFLLSMPEAKPGMLPYANSLRRLGIEVTLRSPFTAEYQNLVAMKRDFDLANTTFTMSLVPGAELQNLFGSRAADQAYSRNTGGIKNPTVDFLIEKIISAKSRTELVTAARALDRVLCWSFYHVSVGNWSSSRWAYWNVFGRPQHQPRFGTGFPDTWWMDSAKEGMVTSGQARANLQNTDQDGRADRRPPAP